MEPTIAPQILLVRLPKYRICGMLSELATTIRRDLNAVVHNIQLLNQRGGLLDDLAIVKATLDCELIDCLPKMMLLVECNLRLPVMLCRSDPLDDLTRWSLIPKSYFFAVDEGIRTCNCRFRYLHNDLWSRILSYFSLEDILSFAQVCPCSYHLMWNVCQSTTTIEFGMSPNNSLEYPFVKRHINSSELYPLYFLPFVYMHNSQLITRFSVTKCKHRDIIVIQQALKWLPNLREFSFQDPPTFNVKGTILSFSSNVFLDTLEWLGQCLNYNAWKRILSTCPSLKKLSLKVLNLEELQLFLSILPRDLDELSIISFVVFDKDFSFQHLINLKKLEIVVHNYPFFTADVSTIELPNLISLSVGSQYSVACFSSIEAFRQTNLEELRLWLPISKTGLDMILSQNPNLKSLTLLHLPIDADLSSLQSLQSLTLVSGEVTNFIFRLGSFILPRSLRHLEIYGVSFTADEIMQFVKQAENLEEIVFLNTEIREVNLFDELNDLMASRNRQLVVKCNENEYVRKQFKKVVLPFIKIVQEKNEPILDYLEIPEGYQRNYEHYDDDDENGDDDDDDDDDDDEYDYDDEDEDDDEYDYDDDDEDDDEDEDDDDDDNHNDEEQYL